ncbi:GNAT family N-acetyltransferase [Sphingomicrobium sp. XHP0235]|uniref:GNAT family N-acetyltransferase n=1 Tax=Sphingomicrobium aquimarinum TaxID=3133971 RepID=UPI0031FE5B55
MEPWSVTLPDGRVISKDLPENYTKDQIREAFAADMREAGYTDLSGQLVLDIPAWENPEKMTAYEPTIRDRLSDLLSDTFAPLAASEHHANRIGDRVASFLDWTPIGDAVGVADAGSDIREGLASGDYAMAAGGGLAALLSMAPLGSEARAAWRNMERPRLSDLLANEDGAIRGWELQRPGYTKFQEGPTSLEVTSDGERYAMLNMINTPPEARGQGSADAAMRELVGAADEAGMTLTLTPEAMDNATSLARLREFYARHGFIPNRGRNKDYEASAAMYRRPE